MRNPVVQEDLDYIVSTADLPWFEFAGTTVLVTGANGILPAYIVETLLYLNERHNIPVRILGLVRSKDRAMRRFSNQIRNKNLHLLVQDVCDPVEVGGPVDFIIHAAGQASPKYFGADPVGTLKANIIGTYNLLELAREKRCKSFLYFSSGEVYGNVNHSPISETDYGYVDPMALRSCYAESKRMGETMCVSWFHQHGVPVRIVRPFHTYGPGMSLTDGRVFADFVANVVERQNIVLKSSGDAIRAFCYLADATVGFFTVLFKGVNAEAYNIGSDTCEISIRDLAEVMVNLFPEYGLCVVWENNKQPTGYLQSRVNKVVPDITKVRALGWAPVFSIEEGFRRTVESYRGNNESK